MGALYSHELKPVLTSLAESVRTYRMPIIVCIIGTIVSIFIFLLMVHNNMRYQERNFYLVSGLEGSLIKTKLVDIFTVVSNSAKYIETKLGPRRVLTGNNQDLARIPEIKSAYLLELSDKVNIKSVIYQGVDTDYIQSITKEVIYSENLKNTMGQFIFLPTGATTKVINFSAHSLDHKHEYIIIALPFAKYGKAWALIYVVDIDELVTSIVRKERQNTDFGANIFMIRQFDDYNFGVMYEYYHNQKARDLRINDKFSIYRQIGQKTFNNEVALEYNSQKFTIIHVPTDEYLTSVVNMNIIVTMLAILTIIGLISYFLFYLINRNIRIQEVVNIRTKELQNASDDLAVKNEELIEINKELEDFTYIVSHDIRSPLINLRGFSDEIKMSADKIKEKVSSGGTRVPESVRNEVNQLVDVEIGESIDYINRAVKSLDGMTSAILEFSRIGKIVLKFEEIDSKRLVEDVLSRYSHQIKSKNITIRIGAMPDIVSDEISLREVFSNIIDNAIKYMPEDRSGRIEISGKIVNDSNNAIFSIRDNGNGIAPEAKKKVFQILRRATLNQKIPGHGMGMPFVKAIIKKLHGRIWFKSTPGKGVTFYFTIPNETKKQSI